MSVFPKFIELYGCSFNRMDVPEDTINKYKSLLPEEIIQFWKEHGFGGFSDGLLWTINPDDYIEYVPQCIQLYPDAIPIMRTAFGDLIICAKSPRGTLIKMIDINNQSLNPIADNILETMEERFCLYEFYLMVLKADLFPAALQSLGKLKCDECYGYEPLLSMGGSNSLENLKIVKFQEYFNIAFQTITQFVD